MLFSLNRNRQSPFRSPLITSGLVCLLFGVAIILAPELLAYIVASFLIMVGTSLCAAGWMRR